MVRVVVAHEGKKHPNGTILPGALVPADREFIPVQWTDGSLLGKASKFERNYETGELSYDIEFQPHRVSVPRHNEETGETEFVTEERPFEYDRDFMEAAAHIQPFKSETEWPNPLIIEEGAIRGITIVLNPGIPKGLAREIKMAEPTYSYLVYARAGAEGRVWFTWLENEEAAVKWVETGLSDIVMAVEE